MKKLGLHGIAILALALIINGLAANRAHAQTPPVGGTQQADGTSGLQGKISSPPPTIPATITSPTSGQTFAKLPITVRGLCTTGMLIKVFSNNIFIGAAQCVNGSYSIESDVFGGDNELVARIFDALDQEGPESNKVRITFQDSQFAAFGQRVSLSSGVAKLGAPVGSPLTWQIILSGGTGPYAISVDWGDGSGADLKSVSFVGPFELSHTYKAAGIYRVVVKATDANGAAAFLQLVGVGSGDVTQSATGSKTSASNKSTTVVKEYMWWPLLLMLPVIIATFWVGMKYELSAIHRQLDRQAQLYNKDVLR